MLLADLKTYAADRVITVPSSEGNNVRSRIEKLKTESADFNKKWCEQIRDLHKEAISNLEQAKDNASDPDLREWATSTLPRLRKNLDLASACYNRVK